MYLQQAVRAQALALLRFTRSEGTGLGLTQRLDMMPGSDRLLADAFTTASDLVITTIYPDPQIQLEERHKLLRMMIGELEQLDVPVTMAHLLLGIDLEMLAALAQVPMFQKRPQFILVMSQRRFAEQLVGWEFATLIAENVAKALSRVGLSFEMSRDSLINYSLSELL